MNRVALAAAGKHCMHAYFARGSDLLLAGDYKGGRESILGRSHWLPWIDWLASAIVVTFASGFCMRTQMHVWLCFAYGCDIGSGL